MKLLTLYRRLPITDYGLLITVVLSLFLPLSVLAQEPFVTCGANPLSCNINELLYVPVRIFNTVLGWAAFVLLGVIVWGGTRMMMFYLSERPQSELEAAKHTLTRGLTGFAIVAGAILMVNTLLFVLGAQNTWFGNILTFFGIR
jgi:hypothetical protein